MKHPFRLIASESSSVVSVVLGCAVDLGLATLELRAGALSGAHTVLASASTINLTTEGVIDWAHWGLGDPTAVNHKAGIASQISDFTVIGAGPVLSALRGGIERRQRRSLRGRVI
jgi:hypothetical protein